MLPHMVQEHRFIEKDRFELYESLTINSCRGAFLVIVRTDEENQTALYDRMRAILANVKMGIIHRWHVNPENSRIWLLQQLSPPNLQGPAQYVERLEHVIGRSAEAKRDLRTLDEHHVDERLSGWESDLLEQLERGQRQRGGRSSRARRRGFGPDIED
jgi:hypothetical protein